MAVIQNFFFSSKKVSEISVGGGGVGGGVGSANNYVDRITFDDATGIITLDRQGLAPLATQSLDTRYRTDAQTLFWDGGSGEITISDGNTIDIDGRYALDVTGGYLKREGSTALGSVGTGNEAIFRDTSTGNLFVQTLQAFAFDGTAFNDVAYTNVNNNFSVDQTFGTNVVVTGNLTVNGTSFIVNTQTVEAKDNLILINSGEVGSGVTAGLAGIEVDRGTATNYQFLFDESDDRFKIGTLGNLQAVATRADSLTNGHLAQWNNSANRFDGVAAGTLSVANSDQLGGVDAVNYATTAFVNAKNVSDFGGFSDLFLRTGNSALGVSASNDFVAIDGSGNLGYRTLASFAFDSTAFDDVAYTNVNNNFSVGQTIGGNTTINGNLNVTQVIKSIATANSIGGAVQDENSFELGRGWLNLYRDDTAAARQIQFGKNGLLHSGILTDTNGLHFVGSDGAADLTIDTSGNVGIGTDSPYGLTHWEDSSTINLIGTNTSADGQTDTSVLSLIGQARGYGNNISKLASIDFKTDATSWFKGNITFNVANSDGTNPALTPLEAMRITSGGNVGIGTTSPSQLMEISGAAGQGTTPPTLRITNTTFYGSTGTLGVPHHAIEFYQEESSGGYPAVAAAIKTINLNVYGIAHALAFYTNNNSATPTERMRIDSLGNVGIGTSSPSARLDVVGNAEINGTVTANLALMGNSSHAGYAVFSHNTNNTLTGYALIQSSGGATFLNAPNGGTLGLRRNNVEIVTVNTSGIDVTGVVTANGQVKGQTVYTERYVVVQDGAGNTTGLATDSSYWTGTGHDFFIASETGKKLLLSAGGTATPAIAIAVGGNVGIGTDSPNAKLSFGTSNLDTNGYDVGTLRLYATGSTIYGLGVSGGQLNYRAGTIVDQHVWYAGTTERMRITSAGNVEIKGSGSIRTNYHVSQVAPRYDTSFFVLQSQHWFGQTNSQIMYLGEAANTISLRGDLDVGGNYTLNGVQFFTSITHYHVIKDKSGRVAMYLGGTGDEGNYYDNTTHYFRNRLASVTYATLNSTSLTLSSSIKTAAPSGGTAKNWKLGNRVVLYTVALDTEEYVEVEIEGHGLVKLAVVNTTGPV